MQLELAGYNADSDNLELVRIKYLVLVRRRYEKCHAINKNKKST